MKSPNITVDNFSNDRWIPWKGGDIEKPIHTGTTATERTTDRCAVSEPVAGAGALVAATHSKKSLTHMCRMRPSLAMSLVGMLGRSTR